MRPRRSPRPEAVHGTSGYLPLEGAESPIGSLPLDGSMGLSDTPLEEETCETQDGSMGLSDTPLGEWPMALDPFRVE
ncbi:hypothetical protein CRG98_034053 [Punica granatum]|uniref:Uncharacterized protein n=1 Tax=Punica granatum TaxID=22663 RepID=A0A2I0INF1_PUNGR|nr:hypothetical protein CRG98_034053 [Punica granatum]